MKVLKFGGTSVEFAKNMRQVREILSIYKGEKILVVFSACRGITDLLIKLTDYAKNRDLNDITEVLHTIYSHHDQIVDELDFKTELAREETQKEVSILKGQLRDIAHGITLLGELTERSRAKILSFGEILSTTIFAHYLASHITRSTFFDARDVMTLRYDNEHSSVDFTSTFAKCSAILSPHFKENDIIVTQGFIGSDNTGNSAVLSRGGSDYSAAVFAAALSASEIQIWTDVPGICTSDPQYFPNAHTIPQMTFAEVRKLSFYGAKVLHPDTVSPAIDYNIPVRVLDTLKPNDSGTLLLNNPPISTPYISAIAMNPYLYISETKISEYGFASDLRLILNGGTLYDLNVSCDQMRVIYAHPSLSERANRAYNHHYPEKNIVGYILVGYNLIPTPLNIELYNEIMRIVLEYSHDLLMIPSIDSIAVYCYPENPGQLYHALHDYIIKKFGTNESIIN